LAAARVSDAARRSEEQVSAAPAAVVADPIAAGAGTAAYLLDAKNANTAQRTGTWLSSAAEVWLQVYLMLGSVTFAAAVKMTCIASNVLFQVSPLPAAKAWQVSKSTGVADAAPYVSIALSGWQWCYYGSFAYWLTGRSSFLVLVQSNCLGALLGTYYVHTFIRHCCVESSLEKLYQYVSAVCSLMLLQISALLLLPEERALYLAGLIASLCSLLSALSMVVTLPEVVRLKDGSSIPGALVSIGLFSALAWATCGRILNDPMVVIPNMFGACACSAALGVKLRYPGPAHTKTGKKCVTWDEESIASTTQPYPPTWTVKNDFHDLKKSAKLPEQCGCYVDPKKSDPFKNFKDLEDPSAGSPPPKGASPEILGLEADGLGGTGGTF